MAEPCLGAIGFLLLLLTLNKFRIFDNLKFHFKTHAVNDSPIVGKNCRGEAGNMRTKRRTAAGIDKRFLFSRCGLGSRTSYIRFRFIMVIFEVHTVIYADWILFTEKPERETGVHINGRRTLHDVRVQETDRLPGRRSSGHHYGGVRGGNLLEKKRFV